MDFKGFFSDIGQEYIDNVKDFWSDTVRPKIEAGVSDWISGVIPDSAEEWINEKVVVPATTETIKTAVRNNVIWIGIGLSVLGLVLFSRRR